MHPVPPPRDSGPFVPRALGLATVLGIVVLHVAASRPMGAFVADDTYIHLTFARNLRDGLGLVFNPGERVYGTTAPLWSLLLGALGWTGGDLLAICRALSAAFGIGAVVLGSIALHRLLDILCRRQGLEPRAARLAWVLGSMAWAVDVWLVRWSASGMEIAFALVLLLAGLIADWRTDPPARSARAPAIWWGVASLARPEMGLLVALLALRSALGPGPLAARLREIGLAVLPAALVNGAWLAYAASFYGTVLPATFHSKAAEQTPPLQNLLIQAQEMGANRGVEILAILALLPLLAAAIRRDWRAHLVPVGWIVLIPLFYASVRILGVTRYMLAIAPLLACYGWAALALWAGRPRRDARALLPRAALIGAGAVALAANVFVLVRFVVPQARAFETIMAGSLIPMARWFETRTDPGTRLAVPHVGAFGYYSHRRIVDLGGLVTPEIGPLLARYTYERVVAEFRFAAVARPDYLIDVDTESRRMLTHSPYAACLEFLDEKPFDNRSIRNREPAFLTAYRIDWTCFDSRPPPAE